MISLGKGQRRIHERRRVIKATCWAVICDVPGSKQWGHSGIDDCGVCIFNTWKDRHEERRLVQLSFFFKEPAVSNLSASNSGAKWPSGDVGAKCAMRVCWCDIKMTSVVGIANIVQCRLKLIDTNDTKLSYKFDPTFNNTKGAGHNIW